MMMIKGSLLRSIPIVKRFLATKNEAKNWGFEGFRRGKNFNPNNQTPLGNQSPPKHVICRKNGVDRCKNVVSRGGQKKLKK